jgi:hypothetical protein
MTKYIVWFLMIVTAIVAAHWLINRLERRRVRLETERLNSRPVIGFASVKSLPATA